MNDSLSFITHIYHFITAFAFYTRPGRFDTPLTAAHGFGYHRGVFSTDDFRATDA